MKTLRTTHQAEPPAPGNIPGTGPAGGATGPLEPEQVAIRAAGMLPEQLLQPGEIIVLLLKPHPLFILLAPLRTLAILLGVAVVGVSIARQSGLYQTAQHVALVCGLLIAARIAWQFLEWMGRVYVLTDQRVVTVVGVLRVRVLETPLQQIAHSELLFSIRERFFLLGTLSFSTAGSGVTEAFWRMVSRPLDVHAKVVETLRRYRR
ncbi:MAG: PH domain-containing protein [Planctomycetota bacterium]